jgi:hypothetical protein
MEVATVEHISSQNKSVKFKQRLLTNLASRLLQTTIITRQNLKPSPEVPLLGQIRHAASPVLQKKQAGHLTVASLIIA